MIRLFDFRRLWKRTASSFVAAFFIAGCAGSIARFSHDTPPDFLAIERSKLEFAMWRLAQGTHDLDRLLHSPRHAHPAKQREVIVLLQSMNDAAAAIDPEMHLKSHPSLRSDLESLRRDIAIALELSKTEPPNYFLAGYVAGSCLTCHRGGTPGQEVNFPSVRQDKE